MSNNIIGKGAVGPQGEQGIQGEQGETGLQGVPGEQGVQGVIGLTGADGAKGDQGDQGADGVNGAKGDQGEQGADGADAGAFAGVSIYNNADLSLTATNAWYLSRLNTTLYNTDTDSYTVNTNYITIKKAGYYNVSYSVNLKMNSGATTNATATLSNSDNSVIYDGGAFAGLFGVSAYEYGSAGRTVTLYFDVDDTVAVYYSYGANITSGELKGSGNSLTITKADGVKGDQGEQGADGIDGVIPSSAETLTGTVIDWDTDATYFKSLTADESFSFTNASDGMILSVVIKVDATERTVSFPIDVKWPDDTEIDKVEASTTRIFTFIGADSNVYATSAGGYV